MRGIIASVNDIVWGAPALLLILSVGLYLTWRLHFVQICFFPEALRRFCRQFLPNRKNEKDSSFRALCAALAATVGTGNLVGVAGAICLGGPGAIFWMWICGLLGMVTKYAEAVLAVRYRVKTPEGYAGGPMYMITLGLSDKFHILAYLYAFFGVLASFGVGNVTQIHAAISGIHEAALVLGREISSRSDVLIAAVFAGIIGVFLFGGALRIYSAAEKMVPLAAASYVLLCIGVLCLKWRNLPDAFSRIIGGAFSPGAVTGGMIGSSFQALRIGCSRGVNQRSRNGNCIHSPCRCGCCASRAAGTDGNHGSLSGYHPDLHTDSPGDSGQWDFHFLWCGCRCAADIPGLFFCFWSRCRPLACWSYDPVCHCYCDWLGTLRCQMCRVFIWQSVLAVLCCFPDCDHSSGYLSGDTNRLAAGRSCQRPDGHSQFDYPGDTDS